MLGRRVKIRVFSVRQYSYSDVKIRDDAIGASPAPVLDTESQARLLLRKSMYTKHASAWDAGRAHGPEYTKCVQYTRRICFRAV